jgi:hypothetical protein
MNLIAAQLKPTIYAILAENGRKLISRDEYMDSLSCINLELVQRYISISGKLTNMYEFMADLRSGIISYIPEGCDEIVLMSSPNVHCYDAQVEMLTETNGEAIDSVKVKLRVIFLKDGEQMRSANHDQLPMKLYAE